MSEFIVFFILYLEKLDIGKPRKDWPIDIADALEHDTPNEEHQDEEYYFFE